MKTLRIGELAGQGGVSTRAFRFYEGAGVLPPPARGTNGYRLYPADAVDMLRFIRQAQGLGLTLAEGKDIAAIRQGGRPPCRHVYRLLQEKARDLDRKLSDLVMLRRRIRESLAAWGRRRAGGGAVCPHIEAPVRRSRRRASRRP